MENAGFLFSTNHQSELLIPEILLDFQMKIVHIKLKNNNFLYIFLSQINKVLPVVFQMDEVLDSFLKEIYPF